MEQAERPIVIGTGLTGLAISHALSRHGLHHLLVGPRPDDQPRLGESLDVTGTLELLDAFPQCADAFFPKAEIRFLLGRTRVRCGLRFRSRSSLAIPLRISRCRPPEALLHVDRARLDQRLFEIVSAERCCDWSDALVESIAYDRATDCVGAVGLSGGRSEPASFVFDATSARGPVSRAVEGECRKLSSRQRVAFAHYARTRPWTAAEDWRESTVLLRLTEGRDGVDGFAWCIPLGEKLSLGAAVEAERCGMDGDELLEAVCRGYARQGVDLAGAYVRQSSSRTFEHYYFMQQRVAGRNWLLAGPSACQVWFMSGAGVGLGLAAARIAPKMIRGATAASRSYTAYVQGLQLSHRILEELRYGDDYDDQLRLSKWFDKLIHSNVKRTARYFALRGNRTGALLSGLGFRLCRAGLALRGYCTIDGVPGGECLDVPLAFVDSHHGEEPPR